MIFIISPNFHSFTQRDSRSPLKRRCIWSPPKKETRMFSNHHIFSDKMLVSGRLTTLWFCGFWGSKYVIPGDHYRYRSPNSTGFFWRFFQPPKKTEEKIRLQGHRSKRCHSSSPSLLQSAHRGVVVVFYGYRVVASWIVSVRTWNTGTKNHGTLWWWLLCEGNSKDSWNEVRCSLTADTFHEILVG